MYNYTSILIFVVCVITQTLTAYSSDSIFENEEVYTVELVRGSDIDKQRYEFLCTKYALRTKSDLGFIKEETLMRISRTQEKLAGAVSDSQDEDSITYFDGVPMVNSRSGKRADACTKVVQYQYELAELDQLMRAIDLQMEERKVIQSKASILGLANSKNKVANVYPIECTPTAVVCFDARLRRHTIPFASVTEESIDKLFTYFLANKDLDGARDATLHIASQAKADKRIERLAAVVCDLSRKVPARELGKAVGDVFRRIDPADSEAVAKAAGERIVSSSSDQLMTVCEIARATSPALRGQLLGKAFGKMDAITISKNLAAMDTHYDMVEPYLDADALLAIGTYALCEKQDFARMSKYYRKAGANGGFDAKARIKAALSEHVAIAPECGYDGNIYAIVACALTPGQKSAIPFGHAQMDAGLRLDGKPFAAPGFTVCIESPYLLGGRQTFTLGSEPVAPAWDTAKLAALKERETARIKATALCDGDAFAEKEVSVTLHPASTLPLVIDDQPTHMLAVAYIDEKDPAAVKLVEMAKETNLADTFGGDESLEGFVKDMVTLTHAYRSLGIIYSNETGVAVGGSRVKAQFVKPMNEVIATKSANCIDGTVLMASALMNAGHDVSLVVIPGHIFLAVVGDNHVTGVEVTALVHDNRDKDFSLAATRHSLLQAVKAGDQELAKAIRTKTARIFNIKECRQLGIRPLKR